MKLGDMVAVCYDGKWGRRVPGVVTATHRGHRIRVRFKLWADDAETEVETWFRVRRGQATLSIRWVGERRVVRHTRTKLQRKYFGGWVADGDPLMPKLFGAPGDWYSVYKWCDEA